MHKQANAAICDHQEDSTEGTAFSLKDGNIKHMNIFESILASKGLSAKEKEQNRIAQEGLVVIAAGGETTAQVLTTATYHLLVNQDTALLRLKKELASVMVQPDEEPDVKTLEQLPWMVSPFTQTANRNLENNLGCRLQ